MFFACATSYTKHVDQSIKTRSKDYRACFDTVYQDAPHGITDGVKLEFLILTTGEIRNLKINSTSVLGEKLGNCITSILKQIQLPHPEQTTRVQYPFVFTKRKSKMDSNF